MSMGPGSTKLGRHEHNGVHSSSLGALRSDGVPLALILLGPYFARHLFRGLSHLYRDLLWIRGLRLPFRGWRQLLPEQVGFGG